jgi:salicylate hydroxylase
MQSPLHIIVIVAGLSGLATAISLAQFGHRVTILEQAQELAEVGAGLQVTPNASRLLKHWNLPESIWSSAVEPKSLTVHRYTGDVLAHDGMFDARIRKRYGAPFIDVHRVDLQQALFNRAKELGVRVYLAERVKIVQDNSSSNSSSSGNKNSFITATVHTESGNSYTGDLVVAADGLWSRCRECLLGQKDNPLPTGDLAYRIVLSIDQISDLKLHDWVRNPQVHFWIGPGAHVVAYSMRGGDMINIVLLVPDTLPPGVSREEGSVEEMRALFLGWDPMYPSLSPSIETYVVRDANLYSLTQFLSYVDKVDKWKLMHRTPP